jgi:ferredoxin-NADP reductase
MRVVLVEKIVEATNITTFRWQPEAPVNYTAGQFVQMTLQHNKPDDRGIKRWFTLSSSPTDQFLAVTTKFAGDKSSTFKKALFALKPGDSVEINEPEGDFVLPEDPSIKLVFIAGGIGVTPYHSMIKCLNDKGQKRPIKLLYAAQNADEMAFKDFFTGYGVELKPFVNQRLTTEIIMQEIGNPAGKLTYVSGPEPMVEALTDSLVKAGLPADKLKSDYFPGYENNYSS